jgi:hypothetical protein
MKHVGSHAAFWAAIATGVLLGAAERGRATAAADNHFSSA